MKTVKKVELYLGMATPVATLLFIYFGVVRILFRDLRFKNTAGGEISILFLFGVIFIISCLVALGAHYDAKDDSEIGAFLLRFSGMGIIVSLGFWGLIVLVWGGALLGILAYTPVILSVITIFLSRISKEKSEFTIK